MNDALKKAQKKASSPEARAKAVATMKRRRAEKLKLAQTMAKDPFGAAVLLKHAKKVTKGKKRKVQSIPLDMIPDDTPRKKYPKKPSVKAKSATRQEVVLALLKYLNDE